MAVLSFTSEPATTNDLGNIAENTVTYCAFIDGRHIPDCWVELASVPEATAKTAFKTYLTSMGFAWDSEI